MNSVIQKIEDRALRKDVARLETVLRQKNRAAPAAS